MSEVVMFILTPTHSIPCDECGNEALRLAVDRKAEGWVAHLCPVHLASFLQGYLDNPELACRQLRSKRLVVPDL